MGPDPFFKVLCATNIMLIIAFAKEHVNKITHLFYLIRLRRRIRLIYPP